MTQNPSLRALALRLIAEHGADAWEVDHTRDHLIILGVFACRGDDRRGAVKKTPRAAARRRGKAAA
jgi:hypothetical protein